MSLSQEDALLGRIAQHYKLVSLEQLTAATQKALAKSPPGDVGQALLEMKVITQEQLTWLFGARDQYLAKQGGAAPARPSAPQAAAASPSAPRPAASAPQATPGVQASAPAAAAGAALPPLSHILAKGMEVKASDIHIHSAAPLQYRINGVLKELRSGLLDAASVEACLMAGLTPEQRTALQENLEIDLALVLPGVGRFRCSFYRQQRGWDAVFRPIAPVPPTLASLGLPPVLERLTEFHQGLVLLTGPAGSGKSSTMAALVDRVNASRTDHIITVEDPIEYVHTPKSCVVNQREAGKHTRSFANALKAALREDPDVIVIGELRDLETISLAITAAETGHLVLGTLHTNNAIRTINRILDVFPPKQQSQIRAMVSESLRGIVSQRLVPSIDGSRRVPACEVLFVKPSVSNLIREEKTFQIRSIMQTAKADGMCLLDDSLLELVKSGQITKDAARAVCEDPKRFA